MKLSDYLDPRLVKVPLSARNKTDAITELVDLVAACDGTTDRDRLLECVMARERQRTTAVGRGLAIPHAKCDACSGLVIAMGKTDGPLEFDAIDRNPVHLVVLMASPMEMAGLQIQMLARLSRLVVNDDALQRILAADTPAALIDVVRAYEAA